MTATQETLPAGDPRHNRGGYTYYGCRCPVCTEANNEYFRQRRRGNASPSDRWPQLP